MRRLLVYMRPYRLVVLASLILLLIDSIFQIIGPLITKLAVDRYLVPTTHAQTFPFVDKWLSHNPWTGLSQLALAYVVVVLCGFVFDFGQTYLMQWTEIGRASCRERV